MKTRIEQIRAMSARELAHFLGEVMDNALDLCPQMPICEDCADEGKDIPTEWRDNCVTAWLNGVGTLHDKGVAAGCDTCGNSMTAPDGEVGCSAGAPCHVTRGECWRPKDKAKKE